MRGSDHKQLMVQHFSMTARGKIALKMNTYIHLKSQLEDLFLLLMYSA